MSDGERIERMIYDWLERNCPEGPTWYDNPKGGNAPALEIRMTAAFGDIEYNICNGGWAQFLWNCFPHWRQTIAVAKEGYVLIGAPEQSTALDEIYALCERDEQECDQAIRRSIAEYDGRIDAHPHFAEFTSRSYSAPANDWEHLFWGDALYEKRLTWLAANETRVRRALGLD